MATYTRHFNAETRSFYYKKCYVSVSEQYMGFDSLGHPSSFLVLINKARLATRQDLIDLQRNPNLKDDFFRDGNDIYRFDLANIKIETIRNSLFSFHTIDWAIQKAKEMVDAM